MGVSSTDDIGSARTGERREKRAGRGAPSTPTFRGGAQPAKEKAQPRGWREAGAYTVVATGRRRLRKKEEGSGHRCRTLQRGQVP